MTVPENPSAPPLRLAVQGTGNWGRNLVRACGKVSDAVLSWIVDPDPNALFAATNLAPKTAAVSRIEETNFDFDAAVIATWARDHVAHAEALIERGIHLLVEKPVAMDADAAARLADAASAAGVTIAVGHQMVFHPLFARLVTAVQEGAVGTVSEIHARRAGPVDMNKEPGVIWTLAPHDLSMIGAILGLAPSAMDARAAYNSSGTAVRADLRLTFEAALARITVDGTPCERHRNFAVNGTGGTLAFEDTRPGGTLLHTTPDGRQTPLFADSDRDALSLECAHFVSSIRNRKPPCTGPAHFTAVTRILAECARSSENT